MIKRLEGYIMLGLIASFSATVALVVYTSRLRDGETEPMRHHHFPPQLSAESKRALAAQAEAQALSAILPTACASPDTNGACKTWAAAGECDKNSKYMHEACAHACRLCSTAPAPQAPPLTIEKDCADLSPFCGQWAAVGECDSNPNYMRSNCRVTCHLCQSPTCHDVDPIRCQADAQAGRCERDPQSMFSECRWACGWCAMLQSSTCRRDVAFPGQSPAAAPGTTTTMFERILSPEFAQYKPIVHSRDPWLITIDDFLTPDEADRIIQLGSTHWGRSIAGDGVQAVRTSSTAWCEHSGCGTDPVVKDIRRRIMELTGVPEENAEHLQILRYQSGQFYKRHHDQNAPSASAWGPRLYTFYMYLNDVDEGGETYFPLLNVSVKPKRGRAAMWPSVLDHKPTHRDDRTDHEAVEVRKGTKYGANYWLHMWDFQHPSRAGCSNQETFGNW